MGSELDNAREALAHIERAVVECRAGARLIDVDDGLLCLDDEAAIDTIGTVEGATDTALGALRKLQALAADWVQTCEAWAMIRIPLTEGVGDGKACH